MKLFRRIFLQALLAVVIISQATLIYFLYEAQQQTVNDWRKNEQTEYTNKLREMDRRLESTGLIFHTGNTETDVIRLELINVFREVFGSNGALFYKGECVYNSSPYEFNYKELWENTDKRSEGDSIPVQKVEDKKILILMSSEMYMGNSYTVVFYNDITEIYERTARLFAKGLMMTLVLLLLAGGILYRSLSYTIRPLLQLKDAAAAISEGNYQVRVDDSRKDEIGQLAKSFNHMAMTVQENIEALISTNETQRRMLGSLAHELKTPMTAIIGYTDTLLTVRLSDRRREQALTYIGRECRRLSRLSVKMLELTGLYEEKKQAVDFEKCQVRELLDNVRQLMKFKLSEKNIDLETECIPENLSWEMDQDMMVSFLVNLVDNAYKASENGGKIFIHADEQGITVKDQGRGIPEEELNRVTEAFYMVDKSRSRSSGGAGLGLALCKEIAGLHGAQLIIKSKEGAGTSVIFQRLQNGYTLEDIRKNAL